MRGGGDDKSLVLCIIADITYQIPLISNENLHSVRVTYHF